MTAFEHAKVTLDDPDHFARLVHGADFPDTGDVEFCTKAGATVGGRPAVAISFTVEVKGKRKRVQTVTTLRNFLLIADAMRARHAESLK